MGMIELNKIKYLVNYTKMNQLKLYPSKTTNKADKNSIIKKSNFDKELTSISNLPILDLGYLEFIAILVSFPEYTTIPKIFPEAKTVLAHKVFSNFNDYLITSPFSPPS